MSESLLDLALMGVAGGSSIPLVPTLPADASLYAGQVRIAPRWPLLASAPATVVINQRYRLAGRNVAELNGPDKLTLPVIPSMGSTDWKISSNISDLGASSGAGSFYRAYTDGGLNPLTIGISSTGNIICDWREGGVIVATLQVTLPFTIFEKAFYFSFEKVSNVFTLSITCDGSTNTSSRTMISSGWYGEADLITSTYYQDGSSTIRPLQVYGIKQYINGVLIDNIPCLEQSGITLANTTTPARVATLSDSTAHAFVSGLTDDAPYGTEYLGVGGSWVAQPSVTFGTWKSRPVVSLNGLDVFSLPLIQNMATTDWKIFGSVYDLSATSSVSPFFRAKKGAGSPLTLSLNSGNQLSCSFRDNTESVVLTLAVPVTINNQQFQYTVEKSGTTATLTLIYAGLKLSVSGNIGATFDGDGIDQFRYSDEVPGIRPVLVYGHQSWVNGSLVDTFPCDDGTGLTVRNTTTPSRPGTITDNAPVGVWVYSWVPLS